MVKVSVVIPTYAPPSDGLAKLIASLDHQTLSTDDFEVIFVDDGSPDDTWDRLQKIAAERPHVRLERIENSGWPSRPRNVGIEMARGEYIAFMDHDDQLYPRALEAAYEYGHANKADVVNGKEARTNDPSWGLTTYVKDFAQAIGREDIHPLIALNPHKLYRREFLIEHDIRFPEGGRVMWEDQFFNFQAARHADVISTLSREPYYHWVTTPGSGSTGFLKRDPVYWSTLERLCRAIDDELGEDRLQLQRMQLLRHQYTTRVLGPFVSSFPTRPEDERRLIFDRCRELQSEFGLQRFDDTLSSSQRVRAHLLSTGRRDLMELACVEDAAVPGWGRLEAMEWRAGVLHVRAAVDWVDSKGRRPTIRRQGERIEKVLPEPLASAIPPELLDMTSEVSDATIRLVARSRRSRIAWIQPSEVVLQPRDDERGLVALSATLKGTLDPETGALGRPLEGDTYWDLSAYCRFGHATTNRLLKTDLPATVSLTDARLHLAYSNLSGEMTVIVDGEIEAVRRLNPVEASHLSDGSVRIRLAGVHDGEGSISTHVGVRRSAADRFADVAATLTVAGGRAELLLAPDQRVVHVRVGDRNPGNPTDWVLSGKDGRTKLVPGAQPVEEKPAVEQSKRTGARAVGGRILRRLGLRR